MTDKKLVHVIPTGLAFIDGVPAVEQDVTPEEAERLTAHQPAAFVLEPSKPSTGAAAPTAERP